jgi:hypothetical protein
LLLAACAAAAALLFIGHTATAQSATGTVTGRVLWGNCLRAIPLPTTPGAQAQPGQSSPAGQAPGQPQTPAQVGLPAGAVLVAVQSTAVSARTDETGRFSLQGVPAGQYLTVAAGPVADAAAAVAARPNVMVNGGQSVDLGTLMLGGTGPIGTGIACRVLPPMITPQGVPDTSSDATSIPEDTSTP